MTRLILAVAAFILFTLPAVADPEPVILRDVTSYRYVDPPGIIVSPISPSVIDACTRATIKFPVTWPPERRVLSLDLPGLRHPFELPLPDLHLPRWRDRER